MNDGSRGAIYPAESRSPFAAYPAAVVESTLERILGSRTFVRSQRHRAFLRHVVGAVVAGRHEELREIVIGLEVFGRNVAEYDPRRDPIVRVEAGRVRDKLARYYASEGAQDPFEIEIPVGGYLPRLSSRRETASAQPNLGSLTVLPFSTSSTHPEDGAFCEALVNQLVDALSRVPGLRVIGRTSASKAREQDLGRKALGRLLGVSSVIEGSVQRSGTRYRCIVQQFRTRDGVCLWSQRFEGAYDGNVDAFALQDAICDGVVAAVTDRQGPPVSTSPAASAIVRSEARSLFERGRYLAQRLAIEDLRKAITLFERAVAVDPGLAPAYSKMATCQSVLAMLVAAPVASTFADVLRNATRAVELDPADGEALSIIAHIAFRLEHDFPRAETMFRNALRHAPNSTRAHSSFAGALVYNGHYIEGLQHARIALQLDPLNVLLRFEYALMNAFSRDYETAIKELEMVIDVEPEQFFALVMLGMTHTWRGDHEAAIEPFAHAAAVGPDHPVPGFCRAVSLGARGYIDEGRRFLAEHVEKIGDKPYARYNRAMAEAYLQDRAAMYTSLRIAAAAKELVMNSFAVDPTFDPYRSEPELVSLIKAHGLPVLPPSPFLTAVVGGR